jgi:galactokinase
MQGEVERIHRVAESEARGFFTSDESIWIGRAPGRLDVMGGVADYSGSVVLESPIANSAVVAIQRRSDRLLRAWTIGSEARSVEHPLVELSLDDMRDPGTGELIPPDAMRRRFQTCGHRWAGYVLGVLYAIQAFGPRLRLEQGANVLVSSDVPMGAGVSSSAALEVATMVAAEAAYGFHLDDLELARLCQLVEHRMVGAPCGIMDQVTCGLGHSGKLLALLCQPHEVIGHHAVPPGCRFVGIDSGVKHSIAANRYVRARVGAFMGLRIIASIAGADTYRGYLCNVTPSQFRQHYYHRIPGSIQGRSFLDEFGPIDDTATKVDPDQTYSPRGCAEHAIYENDRVRRFAALIDGEWVERHSLEAAGRLMYGSHWSYGNRCGLGSRETDIIVRLAKSYSYAGVMGAKITGGGSGGTVVLLLASNGVTHDPVDAIAQEYYQATGIRPRVIAGTSPGAREWGVHRLAP